MRHLLFVSAALLALSMPAAAEFRTIQQAYEVDLSNLRLPAAEAGTIAFKACDECATKTKRVGDFTRWVLNGQTLSFGEFLEGVNAIANPEDAYVTVVHHLEDDRITKVAVGIP